MKATNKMCKSSVNFWFFTSRVDKLIVMDLRLILRLSSLQGHPLLVLLNGWPENISSQYGKSNGILKLLRESQA